MNKANFNKEYGIRKLNDLLVPKVVNLDDIVLPQYSILYIFNHNSDLFPSKEQVILDKYDDIHVYSPTIYSNAISDYLKAVKVNPRAVSKKLMKEHRDLNILTYDKFKMLIGKNSKVLKRELCVVNYNHIHSGYTYLDNTAGYKEKYNNGLASLVKDVMDTDGMIKQNNSLYTHYITLELPDTIYTMDILLKYLKEDKPTTAMLKLFYDTSRLLLLDLFKLFYSGGSDSLLKPLLGNKLRDRVTIIYKKGDMGIFINLVELVSFSLLYEKYDNDTKFDDKRMLKTFYIFIKNVISLSTHNVDIEEIEKTKEFNLVKSESNKPTDVNDADDIDVVVSDEDIVDTTSNISRDTVIEVKSNDNAYRDKDIKHIVNASDLDEANDHIETAYRNKELKPQQYKKIKDIMTATLNSKDPFDGKHKISDMIKITEDDLKIDKTVMPELNTVYDKNDLGNIIGDRDRSYINKLYRKDIISCIMGIQKAGLIVKDISREVDDNLLGKTETYTIELSDMGKSSYKVIVKLPIINEDGSYRISGSDYILKKQKIDVIFKKIKSDRVALSSAYGKLFVDKAPVKSLDRGFSIKRELSKMLDSGEIKTLFLGTINIMDEVLPIDYTTMAKYVKKIVTANYEFTFNYFKRDEFVNALGYKLDKVEGGSYTVTGSVRKSKELLVMDKDSNVYIYNGKTYTPTDDILTLLNVDKSKLKIEYPLLRVYKDRIPVILILISYMGVTTLLDKVGIEYSVVDGGKNKTEDDNDMLFKFKFSTLIVKPKNPIETSLIAGLNHYKDINKIEFDVFNNTNLFKSYFAKQKLRLVVMTEIELVNKLFVDPISRTILEKNNEPTTFIGLLLKSNEVLVNDNFVNPNKTSGFVFKGYERVPQFVYKNLVASIKTKKNEEFFGKSKLVVDPMAAWKELNQDSASELVKDLNPIAKLKLSEDTTYLGNGGMSKEAMGKSTRSMHPDDVGVISESSKDNSDVGITSYMSANPQLGSLRGEKANTDDLSWSNVLSTSAMLAPFSTKDDGKRILYTNIQNSHIVPISNAKVFPIRTGYDSVLPYKLGKESVGYSKGDGKVTKLDKGKATVTYKDGKKETFEYGDWTSGEESHTSFKHIMKANVIEGQTVKQGDIIYYDSGFFAPDMFDSTKVSYRAGTIANTSWIEIEESDEDAVTISKELASNTGVTVIKIRETTLDMDDEIKDLIAVGTEVGPNSELFTLSTSILDDDKLNDKTMELLQGFAKAAPKSKYKGKIIKIEARFNFEPKDASESIRNLIDISSKYMPKGSKGKPYSGRVNGSYSINGVPLEEGKVQVKFYIETKAGMVTGDKGIVANQLKTTLTSTFASDINTESGEKVDIQFSYKGNLARIIRSSDLQGTTATLMDVITKQAIEMYFK